MKIIRNLLKGIKWVGIGILVILVLLIISVFIQTKINPDKVPSIFGYKPFIVLSGSMETQIYKGDLVIVKNVEPSTLQENDIIAFKDTEGYVVTHRIIDIVNFNGSRGFITKGDNNNTEDAEMVSFDRVEGIYTFKIDGFGNVLLTLQKPLTLGIVLAIIIIFGIFWIVFDNKKLSIDERKELEELRKKTQDN